MKLILEVGFKYIDEPLSESTEIVKCPSQEGHFYFCCFTAIHRCYSQNTTAVCNDDAAGRVQTKKRRNTAALSSINTIY